MNKLKQIYAASDFLYSNNKARTYGEKGITEIMRYQIELATGLELQYFHFDRIKFFELSKLTTNENIFNTPYLVSDIKQQSIDFLKSCFPDDVLFIGTGISTQTQELLNKIGVIFINYWNHPIHYLDDVFFAWNTNSPDIHKEMLKYKVDERLFYLYANYFKIKLMWEKEESDPIYIYILDNSALFIGQSMTDKSVEKNGKFLNITHFKENILNLKNKYSKLYYAPHPKHQFNDEVRMFINEHKDFIEVINGVGTYELLANPKIKKVIGISSSALLEAKYFGKDVEYLFKPFCEFNDEFDFRNNYIGIYKDNYSISFWQNILKPVMNVTSEPDLTYLTFTNRVRDLNPTAMYWGYKELDKIQNFINCTNTNFNLLFTNNKKKKHNFFKKLFKKG